MSRRLTILLLAASVAACGKGTQKSGAAASSATSDQVLSDEASNAAAAASSGAAASASGNPVSGVFDSSVVGPTLPKGEGFVVLDDIRTWYRRTEGGSGIPVILIHDGPGGSSFSLKSLEGLSVDRPVVRYDQGGSGRSDAMYDPRYFNLEHYVQELDSIRGRFKYQKVHLVAHSFGGIIALEFYKAHPQYVASITIESPEIDFPALRASIDKRIKQLPDSLRKVLQEPHKFGTTARMDYQVALMQFVRRNVCCVRVVGPDVDSMAQSMNDTAYSQLRGANEISIDGRLADYSAVPILRTVNVPVLFTVGENDVADPPTVQRFAAQTPNARVVVIKEAMHFPMWDAPEENLRIVREFLRQADAGGTRR